MVITAILGTKGGYFWRFGDLAIARAYSETGDPVLTQTVREHTADDLYGTVGLQVNYNIKISRVILQPFVRAEYELMAELAED